MRQNDRRLLYLNTPYLAPDTAVFSALAGAALGGVDVRLMIPHIPDKKFPFLLTRSYARELERCGVQVMEYTDGFLHAKSVVADGVAFVSSYNLDFRSLYLQSECGVAVKSPTLADKLAADFLAAWAGGTFGTSPEFPSSNFFTCITAVFRFPYGLYGLGICIGALALLIVMVMRMGYSETGEYDRERNLIYSNKGTYGTAGFMSKKDLKGVLDLVPNIRKHHGIILGELDGQVVCVPEKTRFNGNLAVYGASGSKKTRAFCMNMILQSAARKQSLIICDPKSELYEKSSEYLRSQGYTVKVFNLVTPASSDSWNCLAEIKGQELMAQLFCDVIIKNTGSGKGDHFWDNAETNLLKALVLYVERSYPKKKRNIGEVYKLLSLSTAEELNAIFDNLPITHPAKGPYSIFKQSSESVRGGVIIGLGSRLQVFQNRDICNLTSYDEINLELPGRQPCAYYCITSDQDSTFDFLSSLFLSFVFIRLVRYADQECPGGALPVPVHVLGEELCACGVIPGSVLASRHQTRLFSSTMKSILA